MYRDQDQRDFALQLRNEPIPSHGNSLWNWTGRSI